MKRLLTLLAAALSLMAAEPVVIQNARVLTVTKGSFQGAVLIRDGKIAEVGEKVLVPPGAQVIDAGGQYLMPGMIDSHTHIAMEGTNEASVSVSSIARVEDILNPDDVSIYRALAGGVTTAHILHGSANSIGGTSIVIKSRWGRDVNGLVLQGALPGLKFALGENPNRAGRASPLGPPPRYPATRMGVEDVIRRGFIEAKQYQREWRDYEAKRKQGVAAAPPRRDLRLEPIVEVLEGRRLTHVHAYRADEILMMIRLAEELGFKIQSFEHGLEGYKVAKEIAAHGAGVSTFSDWWAYKMEVIDAIPFNAALMARKGVLVSLNSDDTTAALMTRLNTEAAKTMKYGGLDETEALALITINPARQLRIDNRVGSIEPGKDADLVIYDKHPLSSFARVQKVFIDGQVYFDRDRDLSGRAEREARKKVLLDRQKEREKEQKRTPSSRRPS